MAYIAGPAVPGNRQGLNKDNGIVMTETLYRSEIYSLPLISRGRVRDIYAVGTEHLLIVNTDRACAFDTALPDAIPGKGRVITQLSNFWMDQFDDLVADQRVNFPLERFLTDAEIQQVQSRALVVQRLEALPFESIVHGYLAGSAWQKYQNSGQVAGVDLPTGLDQAAALPKPVFAPASRDEVAEDRAVSFEQVVEQLGQKRAEQVRDTAIALYQRAAERAGQQGLIIADIRFDFGIDPTGALVLIDEVVTPDSSRIWAAADHRPGSMPASFDMQHVHDYLHERDTSQPLKHLPPEVIDNTAARYAEVRDRLIGQK